ncbi:MauE/DoxX family redox-associated membrane protein [Parapedobacter sp. 10938]|uniref:MauE/DoxX family redox-associated membrane protein n=1 Tax=Parapedobacter flavus TaxID=3110225 RepID=UPI002DB765CE|nr:MauE/DoxX family redox-associated membrane protein [Parapedobacter sp. 10938]MEC3881947.1 MauE/DoxX family redox-associated membrane protein [Parapedobacter sp. 10938]
MKAANSILVITIILIVLFFLTGMEKVWYHTVFRIQLSKQPLPGWAKDVLEWGLPIGELVLVGLLAHWRTVRWGLWASAAILLAFAGYTAYAASEPYGEVVCACGKLFSGLSWTAHFWVNIGLAVIAVTGAVLHHRSANTIEQKEAAAVG